jgi:hypothetical protein
MLGLVEEVLVLPCDLPPRASRSAWAVFGLHADNIRGLEVDEFEVLVYDARDEPTTIRPIIVKDVEVSGVEEA